MASKGLRGGFWYQTMCAWERTVQADQDRTNVVQQSPRLPYYLASAKVP